MHVISKLGWAQALSKLTGDLVGIEELAVSNSYQGHHLISVVAWF